jgi:hypothetical protein
LVLVIVTVLLTVVSITLIIAIRTLNRLTDQVETWLRRSQEEITATMRQAQVTLEHGERLVQAAEQVVRDDVTLTLETARSTLIQVEAVSRDLSETLGSTQRIVGGIAAVTGPGALAMVTQRLLGKSNRLGLLAFGVGAGLRAFFGNSHRHR